jgi:hypothetical protein
MHIYLKKDKQPKTRTTIKAILMSQFDDDEEKDFEKEAKKIRRYYN